MRRLTGKTAIVFVILLGMFCGFTMASEYQRRQRRGWDRQYDARRGVPNWKINKEFPDDVFTFVRIEYDSQGYGYPWDTDYPDADLNLSFRLSQLTSLQVDPQGKIMRLTNPELFHYPFIYIIEPGNMTLREPEVVALRKYLNKGGFLMVDDFWGEYEWRNFAMQMKRVFPEKEIKDVPLDHEIFNIVYPIDKKPMIPSVHSFMRGRVSERPDATEAHYRALFDDDGRIMAFICHNTDLGDGWEREGVDHGYFKAYSEPYAYPIGINVITYAMTH